jgi:hypothetical protein
MARRGPAGCSRSASMRRSARSGRCPKRCLVASCSSPRIVPTGFTTVYLGRVLGRRPLADQRVVRRDHALAGLEERPQVPGASRPHVGEAVRIEGGLGNVAGDGPAPERHLPAQDAGAQADGLGAGAGLVILVQLGDHPPGRGGDRPPRAPERGAREARAEPDAIPLDERGDGSLVSKGQGSSGQTAAVARSARLALTSGCRGPWTG